MFRFMISSGPLKTTPLCHCAILTVVKFLVATPTLQPTALAFGHPQLLITRLRAIQASLQRAGERVRQARKPRDTETTEGRFLDWDAILTIRDQVASATVGAPVLVGRGSVERARQTMFLLFLEVSVRACICKCR